MLKIYTGNCKESFKEITDVTYEFPENSLSPWEQIDWVDDHLEEFKKEEVVVTTYSPYILNYFNLLLIEGKITRDDIEAKELCYLNEELSIFELNIKGNDGLDLIDTTSLSEPISYIYSKYNSIKNGNDDDEDVHDS